MGVAKLGNDLLDAASALTDASAGWVDVFFHRGDGDFGTKASDTGNAFDDNDALIDFVDLFLEESLQETFGGTGDFDLRSFLDAVDIDALDLLDVDLDGLAWFEVLITDHVFLVELDDGSADLDGDALLIASFDDAGEHLSDVILVDVIESDSFRFADLVAKDGADAHSGELRKFVKRAIDAIEVIEFDVGFLGLDEGKKILEVFFFLLFFASWTLEVIDLFFKMLDGL